MHLLFNAVNNTIYLAIHICHDIFFTNLGIIRQLLPKSQGKITYYLRLMEKYSKMFLCQHISFLSLVQIMASAGELYSIFIRKYLSPFYIYIIIWYISKFHTLYCSLIKPQITFDQKLENETFEKLMLSHTAQIPRGIHLGKENGLSLLLDAEVYDYAFSPQKG